MAKLDSAPTFGQVVPVALALKAFVSLDDVTTSLRRVFEGRILSTLLKTIGRFRVRRLGIDYIPFNYGR